jgi:hypothetical protein
MIDRNAAPMRPLLLLALMALAACTEATASRVDERTFRVEGPSMGVSSDAPNRRVASRLCPKGYRVIDSESHKGGPDRVTDEPNPMTVWTVRCL